MLPSWRRRLPKAGLAAARRLRERNTTLSVVTLLVGLLVFFGTLTATSQAAAKAERLVQQARVEQASQERAAQVVVFVSADTIFVNGTAVVPVAEVHEEELTIPALYDALQAEHARGAQGPGIDVVSDKTVVFRVIKRVMATCSAAGFADIGFATAKEDRP